MRVIKTGNTEEKEIKKTCGKCKTKFAYTNSDKKFDREGNYVNCPKCDAFIAVK